MPSQRESPAAALGDHRREEARRMFVSSYLSQRHPVIDEHRREAEAHFVTWWETGMAGGRYVGIPS